jgi:hypothetical protein
MLLAVASGMMSKSAMRPPLSVEPDADSALVPLAARLSTSASGSMPARCASARALSDSSSGSVGSFASAPSRISSAFAGSCFSSAMVASSGGSFFSPEARKFVPHATKSGAATRTAARVLGDLAHAVLRQNPALRRKK